MEELVALLRRADLDFYYEDLADAVWLATHIGPIPASASTPKGKLSIRQK
ncbi:hypothetical protein [Synechococcus sp. PCC 7336]|nr:hypothetical protein [Synechococcus sp. PCC 7336]